MSAPPLPPAFGNYSLRDFTEIVAPAPVSWLPQTAGWAWLGLLLLLGLLWLGYKVGRRWYHNRYRGEAIRSLAQLSAATPDVAAVNGLLKQTALAVFDREQVASLSGQAWLEFLNSRCEQACFDEPAGQLLAVSSYRRDPVDGESWQQLINCSERWITSHRGTPDA